VATYFFHCTDGTDFLLDRRGHEADDCELEAEVVAVLTMRSLPPSYDWSGWVVCVYDEDGHQVSVVPFPDRNAARVRASAHDRRGWGDDILPSGARSAM
jgi:hypothetical protein